VGFIPLWRRDIVSAIEPVSTEEATAMALRPARDEGIFAGTSTGANVVGALRPAVQLGRDATGAAIMVDTGMTYLKTFGATIAMS
jgi:cysteine synthase